MHAAHSGQGQSLRGRSALVEAETGQGVGGAHEGLIKDGATGASKQAVEHPLCVWP